MLVLIPPHSPLLDLLIILIGITGGAAFSRFFLHRDGPGVSGPVFSHTMRNLDTVMVSQNKEIARLSEALTHAEETILSLKHSNEVLRKQVEHMAEELDRLRKLIYQLGQHDMPNTHGIE